MIKKVRNAPLLVVGVGGGSASGKTLLLKSISRFLGDGNIAHLDLDGYHLHTRQERKKLREYPEDIKANDFDKIVNDILSLISGKAIDMPIYDHRKGIFLPPKRLIPKPIVVVEGLHAIKINEIAQKKILDLSIFLYPEEDLRKSWKVRRDVDERNYLYSEVKEEISLREPLVAKYILPQIDIADIVIRMERARNHHIVYRVLLSPAFYNRCFAEKNIKKSVLKFFSKRKVNFENKHYVEIHPKINDTLLDFLKDRMYQLGLIIPKLTAANVKHHEPFSEITPFLSVLIISMVSQR